MEKPIWAAMSYEIVLCSARVCGGAHMHCTTSKNTMKPVVMCCHIVAGHHSMHYNMVQQLRMKVLSFVHIILVRFDMVCDICRIISFHYDPMAEP